MVHFLFYFKKKISENLNGEIYYDFLEDELVNISEDVPLVTRRANWF